MGSLQDLVQRQTDNADALLDEQVKNAFVHGFVELDDVGDAEVEVAFPVMFVEEPTFAYGSILMQGQSMGLGQFPMVNVTVLDWVRVDRGDNHRVFFTGAKLGIAVQGTPGTRLKLTYTFMAQAFRNPTVASQTAGAIL